MERIFVFNVMMVLSHLLKEMYVSIYLLTAMLILQITQQTYIQQIGSASNAKQTIHGLGILLISIQLDIVLLVHLLSLIVMNVMRMDHAQFVRIHIGHRQLVIHVSKFLQKTVIQILKISLQKLDGIIITSNMNSSTFVLVVPKECIGSDHMILQERKITHQKDAQAYAQILMNHALYVQMMDQLAQNVQMD